MKSSEENNKKINKSRGQGYDWASVINSIWNGLRKRVCEKEPNAVYVHYAVRSLHLVLKDAVCMLTDTDMFW